MARMIVTAENFEAAMRIALMDLLIAAGIIGYDTPLSGQRLIDLTYRYIKGLNHGS